MAYFSDTIRDGIRGNVFDNKEKGYVGGAVFNDDFKSVRQYISNNKEDLVKDSINYQDLKYGDYHFKRLAYTKNVKLIYSSKLSVPLKTNIVDNQIYDLGTPIYSNGKMYFNNREIERARNSRSSPHPCAL